MDSHKTRDWGSVVFDSTSTFGTLSPLQKMRAVVESVNHLHTFEAPSHSPPCATPYNQNFVSIMSDPDRTGFYFEKSDSCRAGRSSAKPFDASSERWVCSPDSTNPDVEGPLICVRSTDVRLRSADIDQRIYRPSAKRSATVTPVPLRGWNRPSGTGDLFHDHDPRFSYTIADHPKSTVIGIRDSPRSLEFPMHMNEPLMINDPRSYGSPLLLGYSRSFNDRRWIEVPHVRGSLSDPQSYGLPRTLEYLRLIPGQSRGSSFFNRDNRVENDEEQSSHRVSSWGCGLVK